MKIGMTTLNQSKKEGTKTVWETIKEEQKQISEEEYNNIIDKDTLKWFRRLGGTETATKNYTSRGYNIVKLVSTSPNKEDRTVRTFNFN